MCEGILTNGGFIIPTEQLREKFGSRYNNLLKKLTITHFQKIGPPNHAFMYKIENINGVRYIHLPRTLIKIFLENKILTKFNIMFPPHCKIHTQCQLNIELFENQKIIIEYLCDKIFTQERIANGTATAILNLRAGMGKTFVAGGVISRLKLRTLYIVPKRPLMIQGVKDLRNCFHSDDVNDLKIGSFSKDKTKDGKNISAEQDITFIVINSAMDQPIPFFAGYSLIILDEVHSYCSAQRREIFRLATSPAMLGMSATTEERNDGFDAIAHKELAFDGIIRAENIPGFTYENVEFKCEVNVIKYYGPPEFTQSLKHDSTGRIFTPYMNAQFLRDPYRMKLAISELRKLYDWMGSHGEQHCIYVFCEEREPLKTVFDKLKKSFGDDVDAPELNDVGEFIGGIKDTRITELKNTARILLTTYGYSGTGISIDKMTAILFLTPRRSNMKQILARILRRGGDLTIPRKVVDIVDHKTAIKYQYSSRLLAYEFYGMNIKELRISFDQI